VVLKIQINEALLNKDPVYPFVSLLNAPPDLKYWSRDALAKYYIWSCKSIIRVAEVHRKKKKTSSLTRFIKTTKKKLVHFKFRLPQYEAVDILRKIYEEVLRYENCGLLRRFGFANQYGVAIMGNPEYQTICEINNKGKERNERRSNMAKKKKGSKGKREKVNVLYVRVAKNLNETLGCDPEIDLQGSEEEIKEGIIQAANLVTVEDDLLAETWEVMEELAPDAPVFQEEDDEDEDDDEIAEDENEEDEDDDEDEDEEDEVEDDDEDEDDEEEDDEEDDEEDEDEEDDEDDDDEDEEDEEDEEDDDEIEDEDEEDEDEEDEDEEDEDEEDEDEEDEEEEDMNITDMVKKTRKLDELKELVQENEIFKSLRRKLKNYKGLQGGRELKAAMLKKIEREEKKASKEKAEAEKGKKKGKEKEAKAKGKGKSKEKEKAKGKEKEKAKGKGKAKAGGLSNKGRIYEAWKKKGVTDTEKLSKIVDGAVKESTIGSWIRQWEKGKALPANAK